MFTREEYILDILQEDDVLRSVRAQIDALGMPAVSVAPELGRLLTILVAASGAERVLEIGALGGYSGICLARGLPAHGRLVSLELKPEFAAVAQTNLAAAGFADQVEYRVGPALPSLVQLREQGETFDFVFIDADKPNYPHYLNSVLELSVHGTLIVADNVLLKDRVLNPMNYDPSPAAVRAFNDMLKQNPRLEATLLPVRDGFAIARVRA